MRRILEIIADVLSNAATGVAVTILVAAIGIPQIAGVSAINAEFIISILVYVAVVVGVLIVLRLLSEALLWLSNQLPPNIDIVPVPYTDTEYNSREKYHDDYQLCEIRNKENKEITDCYAVLKGVYVAYPPAGLLNLNLMRAHSANKRLGWKNTDECEIKIGPRTGVEELRVYKLRTDNNSLEHIISDFNVCESDYRWIKRANKEMFFKFELYGKLDGVDFSPVPFYGCVIINFEKTETGTSGQFNIRRAEKGVFEMGQEKEKKTKFFKKRVVERQSLGRNS